MAHLKTQIFSKFIKFSEKNETFIKPVIRLLSALCKSDQRTIYCQNLSKIAKECEVSIVNLTSSIVKSAMIFSAVPEGDDWKVDMLCNLLSVKYDNLFIPDFENDEINDMINFVSTS